MPGTDITAADTELLDADTVPNANQSMTCFSCSAQTVGLFCAQCGQKNDNYRRSIFTLVFEVVTLVTAFEGRIWRTWATLLTKPGKVAREYADGRRTHWSSPVRIYLAMSIILFGFMNCTGTQLFSFDLNVTPKDGVEKVEALLEPDDLKITFNTHFFETQSQIDARNAERNFDLIARKLALADGFSIDINSDGEVLVQPPVTEATTDNPDRMPPNLAPDVTLAETKIEETTSLSPDAREVLPETRDAAPKTSAQNTLSINNQPVDGQIASDSIIRILKDPAIINQDLKTYLPRLMFLMMPFTMFLGAIFIRGRGNALLYDHLIHAAYIHAVTFFMIFIGILAAKFMPGTLIAPGIALFMLIYLPLSLKTMFGRGWIKTLWTSYGVGFNYLVTLIFIMVCITIYGITREFGTG